MSNLYEGGGLSYFLWRVRRAVLCAMHRDQKAERQKVPEHELFLGI